MIINNKMNSSLVKQTVYSKGKIPNILDQHANKLHVSMIKFSKPKKFSFLKQQFKTTLQDSKIEQNSFSQKNIDQQILFNQPITLQVRNKLSIEKSVDNEKEKENEKMKQKDRTKQTFKDFIKKVQTYNKNHLANKIYQEEQVQQNIIVTEDPLLVKTIPKTTMQNYVSVQTNQKSPIIQHQNDNKINFMSPEKTSNSFYNKQYRRSKTEQQIKTQQMGSSNNNSKFQYKIDLKRQNSINQINKNTGSKRACKQLKHISLKLMQRQKISQSQQKPQQQHTPSNISFHSSVNRHKIKQKDLQKHKKLLQTKFSKIRIRFGSSLYNKNLWTIDSSNCASREKLKRQVQYMNSQQLMGTIHNKGKSRPNINSEFCQNRILEAQNIFIQKRRLLPTAEMKSRSNMSKTKKQFFTIPSSLNRYKTDEFEKPSPVKKGQNINGWQIEDQGSTHYKIEQFF